MLALDMPPLAWPGPNLQPSEETAVSDEVAGLRPVVRAVVARVLRTSRRDPDVEDCTSETLRRALEGRARLEPGRSVRAWVIGIARHVAIDALRERAKARSRVEMRRDDDDELSPVDRLADETAGPEQHAGVRQQMERLARALDGFADGQRQALILFHVDGLGYREISERLGVPMGTVGTWVTRGRRQLADAVRDEERKQ